MKKKKRRTATAPPPRKLLQQQNPTTVMEHVLHSLHYDNALHKAGKKRYYQWQFTQTTLFHTKQYNFRVSQNAKQHLSCVCKGEVLLQNCNRSKLTGELPGRSTLVNIDHTVTGTLGVGGGGSRIRGHLSTGSSGAAGGGCT